MFGSSASKLSSSPLEPQGSDEKLVLACRVCPVLCRTLGSGSINKKEEQPSSGTH